MCVLITANLANFDEGGKTGLEGGKNVDPLKNLDEQNAKGK